MYQHILFWNMNIAFDLVYILFFFYYSVGEWMNKIIAKIYVRPKILSGKSDNTYVVTLKITQRHEYKKGQ